MCELLAIYPCSFFSSGEVGWRLVFLLFTFLLSLVLVLVFFFSFWVVYPGKISFVCGKPGP